MLYAALADLGLAYTDVIIQGGKEKGYFKGKEGAKFLESWEQIYIVGSLVTFSPVAVKLVARNSIRMTNYGADLLQVTKTKITNPDVYKRVWELTTKAIHNIEIPNFNKTGLQILRKGVSISGLKYVSKLQNVGVIFVKGAENTYAAIYKGVVIASGKAKEVAKLLYEPLSELSSKVIKRWLDEAIEGVAYITRGDFNGQILKNIQLRKVLVYIDQFKVETQIGNAKGAFKVEGYYYKNGRTLRLKLKNAALFVTDGIKWRLVLRKEATVYHLLHEFMHFRHCQEVGKRAWKALSTVEKEEFVYKKMIEHYKYLTRAELKHANDYINDVFKEYGVTDKLGNPINLELPFDLLSIPKKRQPVNIDKLLKLN